MAASSRLLGRHCGASDRGGVGGTSMGSLARSLVPRPSSPWFVSGSTRSATVSSRRCQRGGLTRSNRPSIGAACLGADGFAPRRRAGEADLIHCPAYTMPIAAGPPVVVTVRRRRHVQPAGVPDRPCAARSCVGNANFTAPFRSLHCPVQGHATSSCGCSTPMSTRLDVAYHGVDDETLPSSVGAGNAQGGQPPGPARSALCRLPRCARPRHNVPGLVRRLDGRRARSGKILRMVCRWAGLGRCRHQAIAEVPLHLRAGTSGIPALPGLARFPRWGSRRRVPELRRGLSGRPSSKLRPVVPHPDDPSRLSLPEGRWRAVPLRRA